MESFHVVIEIDASKLAVVGVRIIRIEVTVENVGERF
jgi:hypothetical protein